MKIGRLRKELEVQRSIWMRLQDQARTMTPDQVVTVAKIAERDISKVLDENPLPRALGGT